MRILDILKSCETRGGAPTAVLYEAEQELGLRLPADYKALLLESDGFEGFIGAQVYVSLWPAADLAILNDAYAVSEFLPGVTLFGTDGGDTGYGFRKVGNRIEYVAVPLVGMVPSAVSVVGDSIIEMLSKLAQ